MRAVQFSNAKSPKDFGERVGKYTVIQQQAVIVRICLFDEAIAPTSWKS
jgi:hypothetical protein